MSDIWIGDLDDDCTLIRYGMMAHVECMDKGHWWFAVYADEGRRGCDSLYNTAENMRGIRLTTGKMARAAAECVMEVLRRTADMTDKGSAP